MTTIRQWLNEYQQSHMNPTNKLLHWVCIPPIVFSVLCALRAIPVGNELVNPATVVGAAALAYYAKLSWRLTAGMVGIFLALAAAVEASYQALGGNLAWAAAAIFVLAWVGQFVGHHIEGARPSFFKDLQFLLIGPLWLLADIYRRLGLPVDDRQAAGAHG